ncbi:MAG: acyl-CoA desaturase [Bacteriovoracaceae bacterium]
MIFAISFLILHWYASLFFQSFYLHRYISHKMFKLSPFWNRVFCLLTIFTQGPSFLRPALYRHLHVRHHQHSDSNLDPHSPHHSSHIMDMMTKTLKEYLSARDLKEDFPKMIKFFDSFILRFSFVAVYCALYLEFTDSYWYLLLVPIHSLMGPIHGAIVNWFGHKSGYRNFETDDHSKNTFVVDLLMMGELYQNNHHANPNRVNFAVKPKEIDLTYLVMAFSKRLIPIK